ncbi:hypothetical protein AWN76_007505 [Rhodothermaceae bacterium RA]|nr:hypothetical protein AWN76_007505 [Rhodothermaceae bacterium RA]
MPVFELTRCRPIRRRTGSAPRGPVLHPSIETIPAVERPLILIVAHDPRVRADLREALAAVPADLDVVAEPAEALDRLAATSYAVVLAHQPLPQMEGTALLARAQATVPSCRRILLTDRLDADLALRAVNEGGVFRLLNAPWTPDELAGAVLQALEEEAPCRADASPDALPDAERASLVALNRSLKKKVMERTWEVVELNRRLQQSFLAAVQAMARLEEMHSHVVGNHSKRVATWARLMAERLDLPPSQVWQVEVAATLHDIGKTHTDPAILMKPPAALSKRERIILRMHVIHGEAIVRLLPDLEEAARYVRSHHERIDGTGYPDRLQGQDIPLGARIIAVANIYDHALHPRESPTSASPEEALLTLQEKAGSRLDPDLVRLLTEIVLENEGDLPGLREVEIHLRDLQPGMVLARDLLTSRNVLLLKAGTPLQQEHIARLLQHHAQDPILDGIFIRRTFPALDAAASPAANPPTGP